MAGLLFRKKYKYKTQYKIKYKHQYKIKYKNKNSKLSIIKFYSII